MNVVHAISHVIGLSESTSALGSGPPEAAHLAHSSLFHRSGVVAIEPSTKLLCRITMVTLPCKRANLGASGL